MEKQPLISVIVPVYNVEEYLPRCLDSIINQTYTNLEILLIDDGATDNSGKICDEYLDADERITVIHQKNGGLSAARNSGLDACEGDYVYFLDSDDFIESNALETLVGAAEKDGSDVVFFDAVSFADTDDFEVKQNYIRKNKYKADSGKAVFAKMVENKEFHSAVPLLLLKKSFLSENKLRFTEKILYEDMVFTYQALCLAATVSQCTQAFYHRRYRKDSIMTSSKSNKHFTSCAEVYRLNAGFTKDPDEAQTSFICRCAFNVFNVYEKLNGKDKKACKKEIAAFRKELLTRNAHGNKALKMRCRGKIFWVIYKIIEKVFKR